ncbi:MAG: Asp-tRNA(Asn)/Glu-tRNA(Gln) amidotransferase subunit GatA [Luteibaculaceae bacterium]
MQFTTLKQVKGAINNGTISLPKLVDYYLDNIEKSKECNIYLEIFDEEAKQKASIIQKKIEQGSAGKLAGMVLALKDNIVYKDHKVTASSKILSGFTSLFSATAVERLLAEDAIFIGRVNCDEFAMGGSNENSAFGVVKNPLNKEKVPGGSSGGSAAAVIADTCLAALGSDTGGSVRQPASFTGTVGFKPTYGRISRHGLIAYGSSFDVIGPITKSVEDAALLLEIMAGPDDFDTTAYSKSPEPYSTLLTAEPNTKKISFSYLKQYIESPGLDSEIKAKLLEIIDKLKQNGHTVTEVSFDYLDYLVPTYYILTTAEASSNLSRYDGMRYGYRSANAAGVEDTIRKSRSEGFGKEVKRRILLGTFVLSSGYYDAYYSKAQKVRRLLRNKTDELFSQSDILLMPTTPTVAFSIGENINDPVTMYLQDIFTVHANLTGNPAISLPLGDTHSSNLPFGIQLMAGRYNDAILLQASQLLTNNF